uniref:Uncharacterized protein n=1 Tax=Octopus bimaculoides TaxID=37653 RepID=A0A0L8GTD4_OCTBM
MIKITNKIVISLSKKKKIKLKMSILQRVIGTTGINPFFLTFFFLPLIIYTTFVCHGLKEKFSLYFYEMFF